MDSQTNDSLDLSKAPLLSHLIELRRRLLYCLGFFLVVFAGAYCVADELYQFLQQPLVSAFGGEQSGRKMIYTGLHEAFFTYLKLAMFAALFVTLPLILMQVWKFLAPGLYRSERKAISPLFVLTPVLFVMGAALAFYVVMPLAWQFFISFEHTAPSNGISLALEARVSEYLSLVIKLILAFGLSFELPILLLVMAKAGMVTADGLRRHRRHAIVVTFLFSALITPPDLISQIALGLPIVLLYEMSIWLIGWTGSDREALAREAASSGT